MFPEGPVHHQTAPGAPSGSLILVSVLFIKLLFKLPEPNYCFQTSWQRIWQRKWKCFNISEKFHEKSTSTFPKSDPWKSRVFQYSRTFPWKKLQNAETLSCSMISLKTFNVFLRFVFFHWIVSIFQLFKGFGQNGTSLMKKLK